MVCGNFILPEPASYVFFYALFNLRKLLYIIEAVNTAMQCIPYPRKSKLVARTNLLRLRRSA